ncbi:hypothetical protein ABZO31_09165 [Streptomyces sp. HUAS MG47]|uniref:hypothetical protein n=1 Tax=Streptomyces solicamelliae TaxID=3231716 RepID=UPI0038781EA7
MFGFSPSDVHGDFVHVERQILMYKSRLYFGPPKGGKKRDVPLPKVLAKRLLTHQERFEPIDITLPWLDPEEPDLAREDRRKVTVPLLVYTGRRGAINRTTWNTKAWKPALADVGVIPPLPERQPGEKPSRVWERSRSGWGTPTRRSRSGRTLTSCRRPARGDCPRSRRGSRISAESP